MTQIMSSYAYCGNRRVHYLTAGNGPPLVLFHQSPRSSAEYVPLMEKWADRFTLIAPDTPGYGQSEPLPRTEVDMNDIAEAQMAFLANIGISRFAAYGYHTGATIALTLASLYPDAVSALVMNGLAVLTDAERKSFLKTYLPPYRPDWSGSHLAWLWARYREQAIFFPWHDTDDKSRMFWDMTDADRLHEQILDHIHAGDAYRSAYRAAFAFKKGKLLEKLRPPALVMAAPPDPLTEHLDRLPDLPPSCRLLRPESAEAALSAARDFLSDHGPETPDTVRPRLSDRPASQNLWRTYLGAHGGLHCHVSAPGKARILVLHDILQNGHTQTGLASAIVDAGYGVVMPDLPGHGLTKLPAEQMADRLADILSQSDTAPQGVVSIGHSCGLARRLADCFCPENLISFNRLRPSENAHPDFSRQILPDLTPRTYGGHLLNGWNYIRLQCLFWPWYAEKKQHVIPVHADIDPDILEARFAALMQVTAPGWQLAARWVRNDPAPANVDILPDWAGNRGDISKPSSKTSHYPASAANRGYGEVVRSLDGLAVS